MKPDDGDDDYPQSNGKLEVFHKYLKPTLKKLCEKDLDHWDKYINQSCRSLVFSGTVHWFEGRQAFIHYCGLHQV